MATGRTVQKYIRPYIDGYSMCGYSRSIGPLDWTFAEGTVDPLCSELTGVMLGQGSISCGTLNAMFDTTAVTSPHVLFKTADASRDVLVAMGIRGEPAQGDPCFMGEFRQSDYIASPGDTPNALTIKFSPWDGVATSMAYCNPWGHLLHENVARTSATGVNTDTGIDDVGYHTDVGGYMMYQATAGAGTGNITAAIIVQASDTNTNVAFNSAGTLVSSGNVNFGSGGVFSPKSGVVALATSAHVHRYLRWQIVFDASCTSLTSVLGFVRNFSN